MMGYPNMAAKYSGPPRLDEKCLKDNLGSGNFIFVCAQNDLFAAEVGAGDVQRIVSHCSEYPHNQYLFQSKNPERFFYFRSLYPKDSVFCTTIESNRHHGVSYAPLPAHRAVSMIALHELGYRTMVTIEPILDFALDPLVNLVEMCQPEWVNIGADSKGHKLPEPSAEKVIALIAALEGKGLKVIGKSNLERLVG